MVLKYLKLYVIIHYVTRNRGIVQLVERWSPKPNVVSSSLAAPASIKETPKIWSKHI